ncbi:transcription elongation protein SprT [Nguyenibacter vanlangensis]|uniref:Transcription elongation protein SprT n=1 Tax=Nguyenibacter vanlangensis TaxID=1216886 RepID=A0ABZ3D1X8_9PROT
MAPRFEALGKPLPPFRVAVGFTSRGMNKTAAGECWDKRASQDGRFEIFVGPQVRGAEDAAFILAHELIHAAVGLQHGHKGEFERIALLMGFPRPLTQIARMTPAMREWIDPLLSAIGNIPHAPLEWSILDEPGAKPKMRRTPGGVEPDGDGEDAPVSSRPKKQSARMIKVACPHCGYTARVTRKWLDIGAPHCPEHGEMKEEDNE